MIEHKILEHLQKFHQIFRQRMEDNQICMENVLGLAIKPFISCAKRMEINCTRKFRDKVWDPKNLLKSIVTAPMVLN